MSNMSDRNLLFGALALQTEAITEPQLIRAIQTWVLDKDRSLGDLLIEHGALNKVHHAAINALLGARVEVFDGDPAMTLAQSQSADVVWRALSHIEDADVQRSVSAMSTKGGSTRNANPQKQPERRSASGVSRYQILHLHEKGGLGQVFVAEDKELGRKVALKELKSSTAHDQSSRNRFVAEAEITGGLEHPGIVPVYGLGYYPDGRPHYAMRLIKGENLQSNLETYHETNWSSQGGDVAKRIAHRRLLHRFIDVCHAVHYAHKRGVVHRDIKPSNIMIGKYNETLVVDWGLAKCVGREDYASASISEKAVVPQSSGSGVDTRLGSAIGTPAFMSPEQARGEHDHVGPATDIFSLGATLFAILTNRGPYDSSDKVLDSARNGIVDRPREHDERIARPLESICLKAMATSPADRYESAKSMAEDIERFLADEKVDSHTEKPSERAGRFLRRHRSWAVAATFAACVISLTSIAFATTVRKQQVATANALQQTDSVLDFLVSAFRSPDPYVDGRDVTVVSVLDRTVGEVEDELGDQPGLRAHVLQALGDTYFQLGVYDKAEATTSKASVLFDATLGPDHPDTLNSRNVLGKIQFEIGESEKATDIHRKVFEARRRVLGESHIDTLWSLKSLANATSESGSQAEAFDLTEELVSLSTTHLGHEHAFTLLARRQLANCYHESKDLDTAESMYEDVWAIQRRDSGRDHPDTIVTLTNLAIVKHVKSVESNSEKLANEATSMFEEALKASRDRLGNDHPQTLDIMNRLAPAYSLGNRIDEAIRLYRTVHQAYQKKRGATHPEALRASQNLGSALLRVGEYDEAKALLEQTLELRRDHKQMGRPATILLRNLTSTYIRLELWGDAIKSSQELHRLQSELLGDRNRRTLETLRLKQAIYQHLGKHEQADRAIESWNAVVGSDLPPPVSMMQLTAAALQAFGAGDFETAKTMLQPAFERQKGTAAASSFVAAHVENIYRNAILRCDSNRAVDDVPGLVDSLEVVFAQADSTSSLQYVHVLMSAERTIETLQTLGRNVKANECASKLRLFKPKRS